MILFILSSLTLLSGCDSNQRQQTKEKQPQVSELSISVDAGLVTDDFLDFIDSFSSTHKIDIQLNERPSGTAGENEVTTELLTKNASDILLFNSGGLFKALDPQEYFYDLSDEYYVDQYIDSYRQAVSIKKEVYGLPMGNVDAIGFIYRKDIYDDLDLSIPNNWEDFEKNLKKIKENSITPILTPFKDQWLTQYYWYVAETSESISGVEQYREVLEKVDRLKSQEFLSQNLLTMSLSMGLNDFGKKNSAHLLGQYSFQNYLTNNHVLDKDKLGFFPFPNQDNQYVYMLPSSLYINKETKNLTHCRLFFEEYFEKKISNLPSTKEQPGILNNAKIKPGRIIYEQQMDYKVDILPELLLDFFTNNLTVDDLLHQYQQRNEELKLIHY